MRNIYISYFRNYAIFNPILQYSLYRPPPRDDFYFPIVKFPFLCSNIPASPAYGVFVSRCLYHDFILRVRQLATELLTQGYLKPRLRSKSSDVINLLQFTPFQSQNLYVTFSKRVKWRLSYKTRTYFYFDKSKWKHGWWGGAGQRGGATRNAQDTYSLRTSGLIHGFRGFMFPL